MFTIAVFYFHSHSSLFVTENQATEAEGNVIDVTVSGSTAYADDRVSSKMALPLDLTASVEEVKVIQSDRNLSNFNENVLKLVENDKKVLIIMT